MIDLFSSERQFTEHALPVWLALPTELRGTAYLGKRSQQAIDELRRGGYRVQVGRPHPRTHHTPTIVASAQDDLTLRETPIIYVEHGAGQTYDSDPVAARHTSYSGGTSHEDVRLFICPSQSVAERWQKQYPDTPTAIVGCPKLDPWYQSSRYQPSSEPVVAISFHVDLHPNQDTCPEMSGAWPYYDEILPALAERFRLLGHGHPRLYPHLIERYKRLGVDHTARFSDVLDRAAIYVVDNSSTGPEFASTGRPIVWLNAPHYRRDVEHGGRFWKDWAGLGEFVNHPDELTDVIEDTLQEKAWRQAIRDQTAASIYAYRDGHAAERAAQAIVEVFGGADG